MADAQTAVNALQSGDIDFLESTPFDLVPVLEANPDLKVQTLNKLGLQTMGRMNFLQPPFDNVKIRRAAFLALRSGRTGRQSSRHPAPSARPRSVRQRR
jgi:peptide/nickel transport system substrate-binding protein